MTANGENWNPGKILETSGYYWRTCTLHAGVKLDIFTAIGEGEKETADVAASIGTEPRATGMLLDALSAMGLIQKEGEKYRNSDAALRFLSKDSDGYIGYMIMHHHHLVESWSRLDEAVVRGEAVRGRSSFSDESRRESFLMGMFNLANLIAPSIAEKIDLSGRKSLLDLGGGPGTYAIHFCRKNPQLGATVFDLPTTKPFAEKTIERFGLLDRIDFSPGDFTVEDLPKGPKGEGYDAAWLSHILHGENPQDCLKIVSKAAAALNPGGLLLIHEFILDDNRDRPLFPALFSLNMLLGTDGGQAYSEGELLEMMARAGLSKIQRVPFVGPNDSGIMAGTRS